MDPNNKRVEDWTSQDWDDAQIASIIENGVIDAVYRCNCGKRWICHWTTDFVSDMCRDCCDDCMAVTTPFYPTKRIIDRIIREVPQCYM